MSGNTGLRKKNESSALRPVVEVGYYTDPLCSWSWGFEPQWRRLCYEFGDHLAVRYRMGGMIADWGRYHDPLNDVSRPLQMVPVWIQVRHLTGMPIDERIWLEDPPESSHPACVAVKAAELQSPEAAALYLRRLRVAVMTQRRNIARRDVLLDVAGELCRDEPGLLALERLAEDLDGPRARQAFAKDVKEARYLGIGRFPALTLRRPGQDPGLILVGHRPYAVLRDTLLSLLPGTKPARHVSHPTEYEAFWQEATQREIREALGQE